jgi:hypothetical protein
MGDTGRSRSRRRAPLWLAGALLAFPPVPAHASNGIHVTARAALEGSTFGLELRLDDPRLVPPVDAYVALGAETGLLRETSLDVEFTLDCSRLSVAAGQDGVGALRFLRLSESTQPSSVRVAVFLEKDPALGWSIGAESWDDASGQRVVLDRAALFAQGQAAGPVRLEIAWAAAPAAPGGAGHLRITRVEPDGTPTLLIRSRDLRNAAQWIERLEVGVLGADQPPGLSGPLLFDRFAVYRAESRPSGPVRRRVELPPVPSPD